MVSQMTPQLAEEAFRRLGSMQPSKSSLDRLLNRLAGLQEEIHRFGDGELAALAEKGSEVLPLEVLHHDEREAGGGADVVHARDVLAS
jgi:hypothetical protein